MSRTSLVPHRRFSRHLACYLCGERKHRITKDHVPPERLYKRRGRPDVADWPTPPTNWPTVPLCEGCKKLTDEAEAEFFEALVVRAGGDTLHWKRYIDDHKGTSHWGQVAKRVRRFPRLRGRPKMGMWFWTDLHHLGAVKLAAAVWWAVFGEPFGIHTPCNYDLENDRSEWPDAKTVGPWFEVRVLEPPGQRIELHVRYLARVVVIIRVDRGARLVAAADGP